MTLLWDKYGKNFDIENITGLCEEDATRKLNEEGFNELPSKKKQSIFSILINILFEPMLLLILVSGLIYHINSAKK